MSSASQPTPSLPPDPTPSQPPPEESESVTPSGSEPPPTQSDPPPPSASQSDPSGSPSAPPTNSESQPTDNPSTPPPTPTPSNNPVESYSAVLSTDANGGVVTVTKVLTRSSTPSPSQSASGGGSTSFFDNKGAMAGTFTVVGLVVLGLLFVVVTWSIRRRRAKQFDRDVAEAAREAAHANPPTFLDDPADDGDRSYATQNYVYSDNSHGTYAQPPMDHYPQQAYNMGEINHNYPSAGAAGVGVMRARSRRELDDAASAGMAGYGAGGGFHGGFGENQSPYPVFSAPGGYQPHDAMYENRYPAMHDHGHGDPAAAAAPVAAAAVSQQPSHTLARQKSQGGRSLVDGYYSGASNDPPVPPPESYASRYQPGYKPDPSQFPLPPPPADMPQASAAAARSSMYRDDDDPYGGYSSPGHQAGDNRQSALDDSDDESEAVHDTRRVLKVANE